MENKNENNYENMEMKSNGGSLIGKLIVPVAIVIILALFAAFIYYVKVIKVKSDLDKEAGYKTEEYVKLGKYTGFDYEITQEDFDASVKEETLTYEPVDREAKEKDQIDFDYTGYVDGKKDKNISGKDAELTIGENEEGVYFAFEKAILGHKAGDTLEVKVDDATEMAEDESDYSGKKVTFKLEITGVSEETNDKVTDEWVYENYFEDDGFENTTDFYNWCVMELKENAKLELWDKALQEATMDSYPQEVYDKVVEEYEQDINYMADQWGVSPEDYKAMFPYTQEELEEEHLNEVKSELVMWAIVKMLFF